MIELAEVKQISDDLIQEFNLVKEDLIYECHLDNKKIGYAIIREKLNIPDNLDENELKRIIFLLNQRLSTTTMEFINSLNFDLESFMSNPINDYYSSMDINPIIGEYGIFDYKNEEIIISVADLIGHDAIVNCGG